MATGTEVVQASFNKYLHRDAGEEGLNYWVPEWEENKAKKIAKGMSVAEAEAAATASLEKNLGLSSERFDLISGDDFDKSSLGIPDDFVFHDENVKVGHRPEDWAADVVSSNVQTYLEDINDQYGVQQGNVVGTEGGDWWGYQMTQNIQSHLAHGDDYNTAYDKAMDTVIRDIGMNTGAINYEKYGTIGYGNPLEIITGTDDHGDHTFEQKYLELSELADLNPTGTKTSEQFVLDEDGSFVLDEEGNKVSTGNINTPFEWQYVPDDSAPGGYRITPVAFNIGGDQTSQVGHNFIMDNYVDDSGKPTFIYSPLGPDGNINVGGFTDGTYNYGAWNQTPAGLADIAAGSYINPNKNLQDLDGDGLLDYRPSNFDHTKYDSNLGLGPNQNLMINWGGGHLTGFYGSPNSTFPLKTFDPDMMMGGGGGNNIISVEESQKSTTAADRAFKQDIRGETSGQGKKDFNTMKYKPTGNIPTLGIPSG